ncbi:unnamed protein product, partial [Ectocarpus sp. 4 AP-2014]
GDIGPCLSIHHVGFSSTFSYRCAPALKVRTRKGECLETLQQPADNNRVLSEALATGQSYHTVSNILLDQALAAMNRVLGGPTAAVRQAVASAESRLQPILREGTTAEAMQTFVTLGGVDDAVILLLEVCMPIIQTLALFHFSTPLSGITIIVQGNYSMFHGR